MNRRSLDDLVALLTDDHELRVLDEPPLAGRDANAEAWRGYFDAFPRYVIEPASIRLDGDVVSIVGATIGSHLGLPDDEERQLPVEWLAEVTDGGLVRSWSVRPVATDLRGR